LFFVPQLAATIILADGVSSSFCWRLFLLLASARTRTKQARENKRQQKELDTLVLFDVVWPLSFMIAGFSCERRCACMCTRTYTYAYTYTYARTVSEVYSDILYPYILS